MAKTTRLGSNQLHILKALVQHGSWQPGSGWIWTNYSITLRAMKALERRGLAQNTGQEAGSRKERYVPTDEAKSFIENLGMPQVSDADRRIVIVMLAENDMGWDPQMGWHYQSPAFTELVLRNLEREGLVVCNDRKKKQYGGRHSLYALAYEYGYNPDLIDE